MSNPLGVTPLGSLPPPPPLGHGRLAGSSRPPSPTAPAPAAPHGPPPAADPGPASPAQSAGPTARLAMVVDPVPQVSFNAADTRQAAIVYLDAVRQRLQRSDPDTYKRFLDTMKDFRAQILTPPLTVIRIRDLFKDHPDLASGFSQFLPESASVAYDPREPTRKRRPSDPSDLLSLPPGKRARGDATPRTSLSERLGLNPPERPDEIRFVELLRERLPKAVYREYLKLLSLFSYEVIDRRTLLERSRPFFGRGPGAKELARMLREVVRPRFKTRDYVMTSGLPVIPSAEKPKADKAEEIQQEQEEEDKPFNAARKPDVDLRSAKRNGHSYRKYPANFPIAKSSGRDLLCQSVLNDQWVSHPTFISEDAQPGGAFAGEASGTPAHRNHFEDAMHRTEDERLEVDLGIDTNLFLVRLLEPVAKRLRGMGEEEKGKLRLPAWSLGGRSRALPLLALERVYGDGAPAREVLQALSDAPAAAVPVVLARLKAKDEEWKAFRRQRNETVWVPDDAKNFAKALDYRGIAARANDKKAISPKAFLVEIEGGRSGWTAEFPDADVFADVGAVLDYYLGLGAADAEETAAVRGFAAGFVRDFFHVGEDDRPAKGEKGKGDLLFANENVFCFFRLFSTIYSRLLKVKEACKAIDRREEVNDTAVSLGLQEVPATPSADGGSDAGSPPSGPDGKPDAYAEVLRLVRRFLRAAFVELAPVRAAADFEDACRRLLGIHGYPVYTADYLVQSLEKIAFAIASEDGDGEVLGLWREWKAGMGAKVLQPPAEGEMAVDGHEWTEEGEYAERVKLLCKDENCFRVEYNPDNRVLHISVLSKPEPKAVDKVEAPLGMSAADEQTLQYLETVDSLRAIEGRSKHLILKRNLRRCLMGPQRPLNRARQGLVVTFNEQAAMMQYKRDSEDYQYRIPDVADPAAREAGLTVIDVFKKLRQKRNARFVNWLMDYEAQAEYPANADQEVFQLLTGMGPKYGMQNWTTRQETVINRALSSTQSTAPTGLGKRLAGRRVPTRSTTPTATSSRSSASPGSCLRRSLPRRRRASRPLRWRHRPGGAVQNPRRRRRRRGRCSWRRWSRSRPRSKAHGCTRGSRSWRGCRRACPGWSTRARCQSCAACASRSRRCGSARGSSSTTGSCRRTRPTSPSGT
ncbi:hypothetical protein DFJ74DRAFT_478190 [Hyaloraphidium curvatum]|nr:hypothetical protein DFJ74DRAFT_478190 [Hyaloraphidium curvatum]